MELKEREFEKFLENFAQFIRIHICRFNLSKYGLDQEDIIQEVRIKLWKLLSSEKYIANYPSYIKKIVNSSVIDQIRKLRREDCIIKYEKQKYISELEHQYHQLSKPKNLEATIGNAIDSLKESRRQVVKLYLLNLNITEIASYLNWSHAKTRNLLYRGLADLRKILKTMDIDYENNQR